MLLEQPENRQLRINRRASRCVRDCKKTVEAGCKLEKVRDPRQRPLGAGTAAGSEHC